MDIFFKEQQLENASLSIFCTEEGIIISSNDEHPPKVLSFIEVEEERIVTCFKDEHALNMLFAIDF